MIWSKTGLIPDRFYLLLRPMRVINSYGTCGCHLCEQAEAIILAVFAANPGLQSILAVECIDIAESDALIRQFGTRIPVLQSADSEECLCWPFDHEGLVTFINRCLEHP
jgi:hypothetical protein